jgi:glycosyltransferase involved in cell wall biosynthesis
VTRRRRLGILATHPIQYFAPLYRRLAAEPSIDVRVFFAHRPTPAEQGVGFGVAFEWDVNLTDGYDHVFLRNRSRQPDLQRFGGCNTPEISGLVMRERFDAFLVSGWNTRSYWQAMRACWRSGTPLLVRGDSQLAPQAPWRAAAKRLAYPPMMRRFDACLAVGVRSAEYFRRYGARRVISSPHFVDNEAFARRADESRERRQALRRQWGIADDAFVPLFAAKFIPKKRPFDLVEAVAAAGRPAMHALFVGEGELRAAAEALAGARGVAASFVGFLNQTEMASAFAAADVLVLPSDHRETWGLVVNEAMAAGLPAIVSEAAGCAPDLVVPAETGFSFPLGDIRRLTDLLRTTCDDRDLAPRMGRRARAHVSRYSVTAAATGIVEGVDAVQGSR